MKRFKEYFKEKRRSAEKNPFIGAWDVLAQYVNDPDVYISFTDVNKIGINPKSQFKTPLGIYTYPIKEFYDKYLYPYMKGNYQGLGRFTELTPSNVKYVGIATKESIGKYAPFAGKSKYINFIKSNNIPRAIKDMDKDYGSADYNRDIGILKKKYGNMTFFDQKKINAVSKSTLKELFEYKVLNGTVPSIIKLKKELPEIKQELNSVFGADWIRVYIHISKMFFKKYPFSEEAFYDIFYNINSFMFDDLIIKEGELDAKDNHPISKMWNTTRLLASRLKDPTSVDIDDINGSAKWNSILTNDLGYSMFGDKYGVGYIHPAEPIQAVFLNTRAFTLLERLPNTPNKDINKGNPNEKI